MSDVATSNLNTPPRFDAMKFLTKYSTLAALLALVVFNLIFTNHFISIQTLNVNLTQVATIVIVGVGMTLVIATGGIDLSVGSMMAISGAIAPLIFLGTAVHISEIHIAVAVGMIVAVLTAGAFGWFNGWLITRFRIQPIIATLVLFIAGRGIDVGAKAEIQSLIKELAEQGLGVLMISSELEEVIEGSDRVFVLREGRNVAEFSGKQISEAAVMAAMAHGAHGDGDQSKSGTAP